MHASVSAASCACCITQWVCARKALMHVTTHTHLLWRATGERRGRVADGGGAGQQPKRQVRIKRCCFISQCSAEQVIQQLKRRLQLLLRQLCEAGRREAPEQLRRNWRDAVGQQL